MKFRSIILSAAAFGAVLIPGQAAQAAVSAVSDQAAQAVSDFYITDHLGRFAAAAICAAGHWSAETTRIWYDAHNEGCNRRVYIRESPGAGWAYCINPYQEKAIPLAYQGGTGISVGAVKSCSEALTSEEKTVLGGATIVK